MYSKTIVDLYSDKKGEISKFLSDFYQKSFNLDDELKWEINFQNPIDMVDIISAFIDNKDSYKINMWISLDRGAFINVTENNIDNLIRYLYERYPY